MEWSKFHLLAFDNRGAIEEVFFDALSVFVEYQRQEKIAANVKPTTFIVSVAHRMFQKKHQSTPLELQIDLPDTP